METLMRRLEAARLAVAAREEGLAGEGGLRVVSMLATGADTAGARAALAVGAELQAILPFTRDRYAQDFACAQDRAVLDELCAASSRTLTLACDGPVPGYEHGGRLLVRNVDVMIAVWDGRPARGPGGTAAVVEDALDAGCAVIVLDPAAPERPGLLWPTLMDRELPHGWIGERPRADPGEHLDAVVAEALGSPADAIAREVRATLFRTRRARRWTRIEFPLVLALAGLTRLRLADLPLGDPEAQTRAEWAALAGAAGAPLLRDEAGERLLARTAQAENLANLYGRVWRGSFVTRVVLGFALSMSAYAAGLLHSGSRGPLLAIGVAVNAWVIVDARRAEGRHWRLRWLEMRHLAERLRHLRVHQLLGLAPVRVPPERRGRLGASEGWAEWYVRRTAREVGLAPLTFDPAFVARAATALRETDLVRQRDYHLRAEALAERADRRLRRLACLSLVGTVAAGVTACGLALAQMGIGLSVPLGASVGAFALLSSFSATVATVRARGDFSSAAQRARTARREIDRVMEILAEPDLSLPRLARAVEHVCAVMGQEVADWKTAAESKTYRSLRVNGER